MWAIIIIAVIIIILIIPAGNKKRKSEDSFNDRNQTVKPTRKTSFLSFIGNWFRNMTKGK